MSAARNLRSASVAVLLLAVTLRIVACLLWSDDLSRDPDAYFALSERLRHGEGFVTPDDLPTAYRPPLYPALLALVSPAGRWGIAGMQVVFGALTTWLVIVVGRRVATDRTALIAGSLIAFDPMLLRYTPQVMTEVTCAFLAVLLLWLMTLATHSLTQPHERVRTTLLLAFCVGAAFGLAVLTRPTFWAFGILSALAGLVFLVRNRVGVRLAFTASISAFAGLLLVVAPWAVRNAAEFGTPILTTTHGGYTLLLSNNPVFWQEVVLSSEQAAWSGESLAAWQQTFETEMAEANIARTDEVSRDEWMRNKALSHIRAEPDVFLRSVVVRLQRFWGLAPTHSAGSAVTWASGVFYGVTHLAMLAGLGWLAMDLARSKRIDPFWVYSVLLVGAFMLVHAIYWTDSRMRAPCLPAVALLAAYGYDSGLRLVGKSRAR